MKKDTRNYGKFHSRFAEGGVVDEPDPNAPERAGSSGYMKDKPGHPENMWWMYKDDYKKADEVSPANKTRDNSVLEPENFQGWQVHNKPYTQEDT
jgi:hypothetical protein